MLFKIFEIHETADADFRCKTKTLAQISGFFVCLLLDTRTVAFDSWFSLKLYI